MTMKNLFAPIRITLSGHFAAALRLAAASDKRSMTSFLEVNLPSIALYKDALGTLDKTLVDLPPVPVQKKALSILSKVSALPAEVPKVDAHILTKVAPEDIESLPEDLVSFSPLRYCHSWEVAARSLGRELALDVRPGYPNSPRTTCYHPCPSEGLDWFTVYTDGLPTSSGTEAEIRG